VAVAGRAGAAEMRAGAVVARVLVATAALESVVAEVFPSFTDQRMEPGESMVLTSWAEGQEYTSDVQYWVAARLQLVVPAIHQFVYRSGSFELSASRLAPEALVGGPQPTVLFSASMELSVGDASPENPAGARTVMIGPFSRSVQSNDFGEVRTGLRFKQALVFCGSGRCSNPEATVKVHSISEVFCFDCPVGFRAIACDPPAGRSTECEPCDSNVTSGRYCTGAHGPYNMPSSILTYQTPSFEVMAGQGYNNLGVYSFLGAPAIAECESGSTCHAGQQVDCPGKFIVDLAPGGDPFDIVGDESPAIFCPQGSRAASPDELLCPAGSFCRNVHTKTPCPAGGFCPAGSRGPRRCPAGSSAAFQGQAACGLCEPGTFQGATGQVSCKSCVDESPPGVSSAGATSCTACNPLGSNGVDKFNKCICKPGASGVTCEPLPSRPVSGGNNGGAATGGGAIPGGASAAPPAGGSSAVSIIAGCVAVLALVAIAVFVAKRRREASTTRQPAPVTELSAQL
jgi:hypothetical protein